MTVFENLSTNQKVRAALHRDVRAMCLETCHCVGLEITRPATAIIAELVLKKLSVYGLDLEAFAKHAKRSTINTEDVKLLARRNSSLKAHLDSVYKTTPPSNKKRRKTKAPVDEVLKSEKGVTPGGVKKPKIDEDDDFVEPGTSKPEAMIVDDRIDLTLDDE